MTELLADLDALWARVQEEAPTAAGLRASTAFDVLREHVAAVLDPPPPTTCHWCGKTADDPTNVYNMLVDVRVEVAYGEEGYSNVLRHACDDHLEPVLSALVAQGFFVHAHGGICYLEPHDCPGYDNPDACPAPEPQYPDDEDD